MTKHEVEIHLNNDVVLIVTYWACQAEKMTMEHPGCEAAVEDWEINTIIVRDENFDSEVLKKYYTEKDCQLILEKCEEAFYEIH